MWVYDQMDTLFRLASHHPHPHPHPQSDQSFNSSRTTTTSSSSRSSRQQQQEQEQHIFHQEQDQEQGECYNIFMDEDDIISSNSSSKLHYHNTNTTTNYNTPTPTPTPTPTCSTPPPTNYYQTSSSSDLINLDHFTLSSNWASDILIQSAKAIAEKDSNQIQRLLWMLNELSSPYGDTDQKLASYFLQALFSRMTDSGDRNYRSLVSASERNCSFESTRKMLLKFQEVSPWTTFGHVACNGAIMEALEGESNLHIIDISNTFCTQWPTLLEAIATRNDETPHLRLTTVMVSKSSDNNATTGGGGGAVHKLMKEIGKRMEKFARLMGVPFTFKLLHHVGDLSELNLAEFDIKEDEALAINCIGALHSVSKIDNKRDYLLSLFRRLQPRIVTLVEEEADLDVGVDGSDFVKGFEECLKWFRVYFDTLEESFTKTSNERLMLEREAGRAIVDLVACSRSESIERRETATRWENRLKAGGYGSILFSDEVCDDVRALLRRYKEGWSMSQSSEASGMFLSWKDQAVVWASAWKP